MVTTSAERAAAHRLTRPTAPVVLRTWHGVEFLSGGDLSGLRGFLIGVCPDNQAVLRVKRCGADLVVCCVPLNSLAGFRTLHNRQSCPGDTCTEGAPINLEIS